MHVTESAKRQPAETRQRILDCAAETILEKGLSGMTLDGVAQLAGVSKGGLLHHFPSKQHLVDAIVTDLHGQFVVKWQKLVDNDPVESGRHTRAYLRALRYERDEMACKLCNILVVEDRNNVTMKTLWGGFVSSLLQQARNSGADPITLAIVQLATDGLWLSEVDGVLKIAPEFQQDIFDRLDEMTYNRNENSTASAIDQNSAKIAK
jgi:AcrR family transcriptional regulator